MTTPDGARCARWRAAVHTRAGDLCRTHADRLPPYLRRPAKPGREGDSR